MPNSYRTFTDVYYAYFVTCTIVDWLPILAQDAYRPIVLNSLAYLREHKHTQLNAFVIMPTHLHAVLWPDEGISLSDILRDYKRFTSRAISKEAVQRDNRHILESLATARQRSRAQDVSQYQVWQEGSHPEALYTAQFARQKIEYIHANPVRAGLVSAPEDWLYSSACAYSRGEETVPAIDALTLW